MSLENELLNCSKFFILDTKKNSQISNIIINEKDETFIRYHYNTHNYNKIVENSAFIYRMPTRASKKRKFFMFGGGIIDKIIKDDISDINGDVVAIIKKPFRFQKEIYQDDVMLNKIKWEIKNKISANGKWKNFFSQYGILEISKNDFKSVLEIQKIVEMNAEAVNDYNDTNYNINHHINMSECRDSFTINVYRDGVKLKKYVIDISEFKKFNYKDQRIGVLSEYVIVNYLTKILNKKYKTEVISETGSRYDIVTYNDDDSIDEIIEVKLTMNRRNSIYTINKTELELAKKEDKYKIYNIFNLDMRNNSCDLEILGYKEIIKNYNIVPIVYRLEKK